MIECDVLVVGAGPAGSSAARAAARGGAKTVFIDKKKEVGIPVQCAEGIGKYLFPYLPFKIPKHLLKWKIDGISLWAEDITIERTGGIWSGYSINRDEFDKWLAEEAVKSGAKLMLETELVDIDIREDFNVTKVMVKTQKGIKKIMPKVIIAADGVDSTILKLLGFDLNLERYAGYVIGYKMKNLKLKNPNYYQVYLGDFAPGAYAYIFPKSYTSANLGIGAIFFDKKLEDCYEEFINLPVIKEQIYDGVVVENRSGWAPIRYPVTDLNYGNILLTGDAANQNIKPFIEGILPAIICGDLAGKTSWKFIYNKEPLTNYIKSIRDTLGFFYKESDSLIDVLYRLGKFPDSRGHLIRLGLFSNIFSISDINKLVEYDYYTIKNNLLNYNSNRMRKFMNNLIERLAILYAKIR
ncbi:geranylgeranyl reductase family protein [Candidatus Pyrohabitans sp.]